MKTDTHTSAHTEAPAQADTPVRVTLVIGSNRTGRFASVIAKWLLDRVREHDGFEVDVVDVAEADLPTTFEPTPGATARLAEITPRLAAAEAFIVLTPEYNHSYPAALKNLIDWHFHEWRAKPVALVSYGGMSGGLRAAEHLRQVFAELHATTVRDTVSFHHAHAAFDDSGHLKDPSAPDAAARVMLDQLSWWGRALREAKRRRPYGG
ncbi:MULTISPECIES: NADPH-dependent FMN reductase [Streptomyces]|uniref:NAD(P)H-dependent oxidoreductase n=2 Tax=Streptomyces griseiscabiei TaxID=2993540 RepID=A0ABU4L1D4_9ACTN|nr:MULTISPECIES: NAD(P)H-dependent oxidoreductase [Streptomyces]MBZ3900597.1 NAD(P)H-dependent oxidoreductase [Streptomyces griseiscabiei]MDX2909280.1 NAD(P)H-dependent oxidoreductase [Streptomyces griseiscabiei]